MMQLLLSPTNNREKKVQDMFYVVVQAESKPFKKEVTA